MLFFGTSSLRDFNIFATVIVRKRNESTLRLFNGSKVIKLWKEYADTLVDIITITVSTI